MIKPTIRFSDYVDFAVRRLGEIGRPIQQGFEFHSRKNSRFQTVSEIAAINDLAELK